MLALEHTTYYPAILLRKRWSEAVASSAGGFDIIQELQRIRDEAPLTSREINDLEQWAARGQHFVPARRRRSARGAGSRSVSGSNGASSATPPSVLGA